MKKKLKPVEAGLTRAQADFILALIEARTIAGAAKNAGVARSTVYRWLEDPKFRDEVSRARRHFLEEGVETLVGGMEKGASRLLEALDAPDRNIRLRAAIAVVQMGLDVAAIADFERRLAELEDRARAPRPPAG